MRSAHLTPKESSNKLKCTLWISNRLRLPGESGRSSVSIWILLIPNGKHLVYGRPRGQSEVPALPSNAPYVVSWPLQGTLEPKKQ